jgi:hypothetical protein
MRADFISAESNKCLASMKLFTVIKNLHTNSTLMVLGSVFPKNSVSLLDLTTGVVSEWCNSKKEDKDFVVLGRVSFTI